jgi:type II secretory pathway predicted ATPase ExeA
VSESTPAPFAPTADTERYLPRAASERALTELESALRDGATRILLHGPPGIGKTLLVRVLEQRAASSFRLAEATYPALPSADLCSWVLRALGEDAGEDPEETLLALASRDRERPLLLLVDDAHSLPPETTSRLRTLTERAGGALRVLAVATAGEAAYALDEALAPERDVRFDEPMSPTELADYVATRLDSAAIPAAVRRRFDAAALARLHDESEGLPGALHHGATALLRGTPSRVPMQAGEPAAMDRTAPIAAPEPLTSEAAPEGGRGRSRQGLLVALLLAALGLGWWALSPSGERPAPEPPLPAPAQLEVESPARDVRARAPFAPDPDSEAATMLDGGFDPGQSTPTPQPVSAETPFTVHVNATPWAEIELDGSPLGVTPLAAIEVEPGRHRFRARMADGRVLQRDVVLSPERRHLVFE